MKTILIWLSVLIAPILHAQPNIPIDPDLGESIVFIKNDKFFSVELETTLFKPEGLGPFPIVVINHGKEGGGSNRFQARSRPIAIVREFLKRGYAVVAPMRQGFSKSGGAVVGDNCNIKANGEAQAEDIVTVVNWLKTQAWADSTRMVMMGQSHGGLTMMAYAQNPDQGFKVFVNFAGGLRFTSGCQWELSLKDAFEKYGEKTKVESIWFYGENDSFFPPNVIQPAHAAYVAAGGKAEMVAFGVFGSDAHGMSGSYAGIPIWLPKVEAKLVANGLPVAIVKNQYEIKRMLVPAASGYAKLDEADKLPQSTYAMKDSYQKFLVIPKPRAFAIAPNGMYGWAWGGDDPLKRALAFCNLKGKGECKLYAVDDDVVWSNQ
jgi:dienelactone hydrolase